MKKRTWESCSFAYPTFGLLELPCTRISNPVSPRHETIYKDVRTNGKNTILPIVAVQVDIIISPWTFRLQYLLVHFKFFQDSKVEDKTSGNVLLICLLRFSRTSACPSRHYVATGTDAKLRNNTIKKS